MKVSIRGRTERYHEGVSTAVVRYHGFPQRRSGTSSTAAVRYQGFPQRRSGTKGFHSSGAVPRVSTEHREHGTCLRLPLPCSLLPHREHGPGPVLGRFRPSLSFASVFFTRVSLSGTLCGVAVTCAMRDGSATGGRAGAAAALSQRRTRRTTVPYRILQFATGANPSLRNQFFPRQRGMQCELRVGAAATDLAGAARCRNDGSDRRSDTYRILQFSRRHKIPRPGTTLQSSLRGKRGSTTPPTRAAQPLTVSPQRTAQRTQRHIPHPPGFQEEPESLVRGYCRVFPAEATREATTAL